MVFSRSDSRCWSFPKVSPGESLPYPHRSYIFNIGEYTSLQRLYAHFSPGTKPRNISSDYESPWLSPEVFILQSSFNKSELVHIIEQGTWEEKVLVFEALNYAAEHNL